jgi:hypothetical protein
MRRGLSHVKNVGAASDAEVHTTREKDKGCYDDNLKDADKNGRRFEHGVQLLVVNVAMLRFLLVIGLRSIRKTGRAKIPPHQVFVLSLDVAELL